MSATNATIEFEKSNLEVHVDLCAQRYTAIEDRLTKIEKKFDVLQDLIETGHKSMSKVIIGTAGTIVTGVLSVLIAILTKIH
jgi:hypothetical protein